MSYRYLPLTLCCAAVITASSASFAQASDAWIDPFNDGKSSSRSDYTVLSAITPLEAMPDERQERERPMRLPSEDWTPQDWEMAEPVAPVTASDEAVAQSVEAPAFTVQVGAFANYDNAQQQLRALSAFGEPRIVPGLSNDVLVYRVQIGGWPRREEAVSMLGALRANGVEAFILPAS